jgi:ABC-type sugar transport system substrate-binding protein
MCVLAACGGGSDSDSSSGSGGKTDEAAVTAAQSRLDPYLKPVENIEVSTPLTKKPDPGKSVYFIRYNLPLATEWDNPLKEAAAALDWKVTVIPVDASDPQSTDNAMLRAVSEGADYINVNSGDLKTMGSGLTAAKDKGIPVFLSAGVGEPEGEANGLYGNVQSENVILGVERLMDKMIVDSKGSAKALLINAPDFPTLAPLEKAVKKHVSDSCSGCSFSTLNISAADLAGDVASPAVAAIRQDPDIKYVVASFDGLVNGLPQALKAAGMDDIKVYIGSPSNTFVKKIESGDYAGGIVVSDKNRGWLEIDQIARQSLGMDVEQEAHGNLSMQLWTTDDMPKGATSWDPPNYQDQYKKLWQVS